MSQLFETLRRGSRVPRRAASERDRAHADAVLATLGYGTKPSRPASPILIGAFAVVAGAGAWYAWHLFTQPVIRPVTSGVRTAGGRGAPGGQPSPPYDGRFAQRHEPAPAAAPPPDRTAVASTEPLPPVRTATRRSAPQAPARRTDDRVFSAALRAQQSGDTTAALQLYGSLLKEQPRHAFAHNNLGLLYQQQGNPAGAVREFELALEADPGYVKARNNLGVAWLVQGRPEQAGAAFRAVLATNPRDVDALVNLALADRAAGHLEIAKETLLRALVLDPSSPAAHYNLAVLYEQSAEPGRAIAHYRAFLDHAGREHDDRAAEVRARLDLLLQRNAGS